MGTMMKEERILEALKLLKRGVVPRREYGICMNLDILLHDIDGSDYIMTYFDEWFGNKAAYPVEGKQRTDKSDLNKVGYENNPEKWNPDTKFGKKRLELVQRLIDAIEEKLNA